MHNTETLTSEQAIHSGDYLSSIDMMHGVNSQYADAVAAVKEKYFDGGNLASALEYMKEEGAVRLTDYWQNSALDNLASSERVDDGFSDATANRQPRNREQYLGRVVMYDQLNPLNEDERFPGLRPRGFEVTEAQQPVMALVALDKNLFHAMDISWRPKARERVLKDIQAALGKAINGEEFEMTRDMNNILTNCLIRNDTFIDAKDSKGNVEKWAKPFDKIASLKAMAVLVSGDEDSSQYRQGAIKAEGLDMVIGASGLNSAIDEMVARSFATDVLAELKA